MTLKHVFSIYLQEGHPLAAESQTRFGISNVPVNDYGPQVVQHQTGGQRRLVLYRICLIRLLHPGAK